MAAPVWNSIELDAVGELHLVLCLQPLPFQCLFLFSMTLTILDDVALRNLFVVGELVCVGRRGQLYTPSSLKSAGRAWIVVDRGCGQVCNRNRGGGIARPLWGLNGDS